MSWSATVIPDHNFWAAGVIPPLDLGPPSLTALKLLLQTDLHTSRQICTPRTNRHWGPRRYHPTTEGVCRPSHVWGAGGSPGEDGDTADDRGPVHGVSDHGHWVRSQLGWRTVG